MEYIKTFALLAVFIFLAFGTIVNNIRHYKENEGERKRKKAEKKEKRAARRRSLGLLFGIYPKPKKDEESLDSDLDSEIEEPEEFEEPEEIEQIEEITEEVTTDDKKVI